MADSLLTNTAVQAGRDAGGEIAQAASLFTNTGDWIAHDWPHIVTSSIIAAAVAALLLSVKWAGHRLCRYAPERTEFTHVAGRSLARIGWWFVIATVAKIVATYGRAPDDLRSIVHFLFVIAATLQAFLVVREIVLGLIANRAPSNEALQNASGLIRVLVSVVLFLIAAVLVLSNLGVNVTGLVAGLGIGGIAIGLAAQGIFADLFASLAIIFDRPFRVGDAIRYDNTTGTVETIGLKTTRIRAQTGEQVVISNTNLLNKQIHNLARLARRRTTQILTLTYQTDPAVVARVPDLLRNIVEACGDTVFLRAGFSAFSASSIDVQFEYDVMSEDFDVVFATRHHVNLAILRRFAEEGIEFAYSTQTTFTAAPDGTLIMPYPVAPARNAASSGDFDGAPPMRLDTSGTQSSQG